MNSRVLSGDNRDERTEGNGETEACGDGRFSAFLFVAALLPRLYVALAWAREPVWDGHYYDFGARRIAAGFGYSDSVMLGGVSQWHPWCHYPVGYSGFLAIFYRIFGAGPHVAPVVNAVTGALLAVAVHRVGLLAFRNPWRARSAGLLLALLPEAIIYAALLMTEPLASLGPIVAVWIAARYRCTFPWRAAAAAGVVLGLATLVRPQTVLGAPALALVFFDATNRSSWRRALGTGILATVTCLGTVLPWTLRNCRVMDGCAFVSTNAGWNLAIGSFPRATGRFETLRATDGCPVVTGQVQQDRCWGRLGVAFIRQEPWRWLTLMPRKLSHTFDHASFPMGYLGEADLERFPERRREQGRVLLTTTYCALLLGAAFVAIGRQATTRRRRLLQGVLAGLLGAVVLAIALRDDHPVWWLAAITPVLAGLPFPGRAPLGPVLRYLVATYGAVVLTHAVFFGEDRYHVVLTPVFALLAAGIGRRSTCPPREGCTGAET